MVNQLILRLFKTLFAPSRDGSDRGAKWIPAALNPLILQNKAYFGWQGSKCSEFDLWMAILGAKAEYRL